VPELVEVEYYRRLAEGALGREISSVRADDSWFLKGGLTASVLEDVLVGRRFSAARRLGKLLLLDTASDGPSLGLRFGMTGHLVLDDRHAVERLEYSSQRRDPIWDRFSLSFSDGGLLTVHDPRRLGGVLVDADEAALGPDAMTITRSALRGALAGSAAPLKARLLDQSRLAGVGNLICDEALWRAGIDPARPAASLTENELRRLHRHLGTTISDLVERGGSHTGRLHHARVRGGMCPKDGAPLLRREVGGRTTYSCPVHQR